MKILKTIIIILVVILVCGFSFSLVGRKTDSKDKAPSSDITDTGYDTIHDGGNTDSGNTDKGEENEPPTEEETPHVFVGKEGFKNDFDSKTMILIDLNEYSHQLKDGIIYPSEFSYENGYGEMTLDNGKLNYACIMSGSNNVGPNFKLKPLESGNGRIYLSDFRILTVDFDIDYDVDTDSPYSNIFGAFLNVRSDSSNSSVCSVDDYYRFEGSGHYTFVFLNTGDLNTMKICIYKDGVYQTSVSDFIYNTEYNPNDLYVSCLNLLLPRTEGDTVSVDNVAFYYFDNDYDGELKNLLDNPRVDLATVRDVKGYKDFRDSLDRDTYDVETERVPFPST